MGLVRSLPLPNGVETSTVAFPVRISDYEGSLRPPPRLGADEDEVRKEWSDDNAR